MDSRTPNEIAMASAREWSGEPTWGPVSTTIWHAVRAAIISDRARSNTDTEEN